MIYVSQKDVLNLLQQIRKEEAHTLAEESLITMIAKEVQFLPRIKIEENKDDKKDN